MIVNGNSGSDVLTVLATVEPISFDTGLGVPDSTVIGNGTLANINANINSEDTGGVGSLNSERLRGHHAARTINFTDGSISGALPGGQHDQL